MYGLIIINHLPLDDGNYAQAQQLFEEAVWESLPSNTFCRATTISSPIGLVMICSHFEVTRTDW